MTVLHGFKQNEENQKYSQTNITQPTGFDGARTVIG